jgi:hypothetical protein
LLTRWMQLCISVLSLCDLAYAPDIYTMRTAKNDRNNQGNEHIKSNV